MEILPLRSEFEITLAPSNLLILSPVTPTLTTYASATNNEIGIATIAGATAGAVIIMSAVFLSEIRRKKAGALCND